MDFEMFVILCRNVPTTAATKALVKWLKITRFVCNYKMQLIWSESFV